MSFNYYYKQSIAICIAKLKNLIYFTYKSYKNLL